MAQYNVDSAQIAQASAATKTIADQIRTDVASMMAQLQQLSGSWSGAASAAFQGCAAQWRVAQAQVEQSLDAISMALAQASSAYEQAESQATGLFAGR